MNAYDYYIGKSDIEQIHDASLQILSEVGVCFESEKALEVFRKNGVKTDGNIVYIDSETVDYALKNAPESFSLVADFDKEIQVGNHSMNTRIIGHPTYMLKDNKICPMQAQDGIDQFKLSETSTVTNCTGLNYAFLNGIQTTKKEHIFAPMAFALKYSQKDKIFLDINVAGFSKEEAYLYTKKGIKLAKRFYGLDNASIMATVFNALSPLCYDEVPIYKMIANLEEDQACIIACCGMPMMTSPPSLAGMLAETNAEILAGIVFSQLYKPGAKVIYGNTSASTDMRTLQLGIGAPETALIGYATAALADYYHLPFRTLGGLSDAKQFDFQAGSESTMMLQATYDVRPDIVIHNTGCIGSFNVVSLEKIIADEEIIRMLLRKKRGIEVTRNILCLEEIKKAGPRGSFLKGRTPKMYRDEFYLPELFNKDDPNNWQNNGAVTIYDSAKKLVKERIEAYETPHRTAEQNKLLDEYLPAVYKQSI